MPGIPSSYSWATADVVDAYADHPGCLLAVWLPESWASQRRTSVIVELPGGGFTSGTTWLDLVHDPNAPRTGGEFPDLALSAGFAFVHVAVPFGWTNENVRYYPSVRHPGMQRLIGRALQRLKTRSAAQRPGENITGDPAHSLAVDDAQYVLKGNSSGADHAGWLAFQHDGALPYWPSDTSAHQWDRWMARASHRCQAVILEDAMTDFRLFDPAAGGVSPNLIALFGNPNRFLAVPKIQDIPPEVLRDASILPLVEADHPTNRDVAVLAVGVGAGEGWIMDDPALTADAFRQLAAPRTPIPGLGDVHEVGTLVLLEDALKRNEANAGRTWSDAKHRIVWGNATNNPDGLHLVDSNLGMTVAEYYLHWITQVVGIPPHLDAGP